VYDRGHVADEVPSFARVRLGGDLDYSRRADLTALLEPLAAEHTAIVDMRSVRFLDTSALACLIALRREMRAAHGSARIILAGLRPEIARVFEVAGLNDAFAMRDASEIHAAPSER